MSLCQPHTFEIPEETARVAKAAFPKGNVYLTMRDELGPIFSDDDFEGEASHWSAGAVYGYEEFTLWNPWRSGKTERAITLQSHGFAMPGIGGTHGHLERRND